MWFFVTVNILQTIPAYRLICLTEFFAKDKSLPQKMLMKLFWRIILMVVGTHGGDSGRSGFVQRIVDNYTFFHQGKF